MAKVLQMPVAVKDVDGMVPYKKDDATEEFEDFEELEDYATPGGDSIEGAIGKIDQVRAGGLEDPIKDFRLLQQKMQLQGMAGGEDFDLEDDGSLVELDDYETPGAMTAEDALQRIDAERAAGTDPIRDFKLAAQAAQIRGMTGGDEFTASADIEEFEDYDTPGGMSLEEATAKAKEAMASAKDMPSYAGYAAQVAGLEQMQGHQTTLKAEGEQVDIPDYQVALSGPKPGSKVLEQPKVNKDIAAPLLQGFTNAFEAFKQQGSKILDKMPKFDELKEAHSKIQEQEVQNPVSKDLNKPTPAPSGKAVPVAEPSRARALPDLSGLKTGGKGARTFELD